MVSILLQLGTDYHDLLSLVRSICLPVRDMVREGATASYNSLAIRVKHRFFKSTFTLIRWIREREDDWLTVETCHQFEYGWSENAIDR